MPLQVLVDNHLLLQVLVDNHHLLQVLVNHNLFFHNPMADHSIPKREQNFTLVDNNLCWKYIWTSEDQKVTQSNINSASASASVHR